MSDGRRITFVILGSDTGDRNWTVPARTKTRLIFLESPSVVQQGLRARGSDLDIERVILDRCIGPDAFLDLLASLPLGLTADVLFIRASDGRGFLSALGRGGDRVLYALSSTDVRFYLETHDLVAPCEMLPRQSDAAAALMNHPGLGRPGRLRSLPKAA